MTLRDRLQRGMAILETLDYCRSVTGKPGLGAAVEKCVVDRELADVALCTEMDSVDQQVKALKEGN